jgi:chemotaxis signal transduction protein
MPPAQSGQGSPSDEHARDLDSPLVEQFISYMRNVQNCERRLGELNFTWRLIEATAKMTCPEEAKTILPAMASTRAGFGALERQLIENLVRQNIRKVTMDLGSRAQVMIDVLVRNLFERTADVGFLATDYDLRRYMASARRDPDADLRSERSLIEGRLKEYRDKYTVYDEIILLSCEGRVLAHLDHSVPLQESRDPLVRATLATDSYVETFRAVDLRPRLERALVYSRKVVDPATGQPLGVLCLCFRFADEMAGIFHSLRTTDDRSAMTLLDGDGVVIASSDESHVRIGTKVAVPPPHDEDQTVDFAGREYFAQTRSTRGYQGYMGPGWRAHVMVPVDTAFRAGALRGDAGRAQAAAAVNASISSELEHVTRQAERINTSLRRVVWNGQVMASGGKGDLVKLKSILQQISEAGAQTSKLFKASILELCSTVESSNLRDAQSVAHLMIDIMDRNLFERAADCRWWSLASDLRRIVANPSRNAADVQALQATLDYINSLYTVYTRIFVYDRAGTIVASSDLHKDGLQVAGQSIDGDTAHRVAALHSTQRYWVTPYEPTGLYGDRAAYIYHAAIRHPDDPSAVVGGIGIVFDGAREFPAMLRDALPNKPGAFALFLERNGRIIASSSEEHQVGSIFAADKKFLALPRGARRSEIVVEGENSFVVGACASQGYREYKRSDDYTNDVIAVVYVPLGKARQAQAAAAPFRESQFTMAKASGQGIFDVAAFTVSEQVYALPAGSVVETVEAHGLVAVREADPMLAGVLAYEVEGHQSAPVVPVIDLRRALGVAPRDPSAGQVIIVHTLSGLFGLLVDDLVGVFDVDRAQREPVKPPINRWARFIASIIKAGGGEASQMMLELDADSLIQIILAGQHELASSEA